MTKDLKSFIVWWNNTFPLDKKYREKYGIAFGSKEHRAVCQIDVLTEYLEGELFEEAINDALEAKEKKEQLEKGILVRVRETPTEREEELMNNVSIDSFKNIKIS